MIAKTPNQKRKSFANAEGGVQSPNAGKPNTPQKTPGKGKGNATPGKFNKTPKTPKVENAGKTPQQAPKIQEQGSGKKNKRPNESAAGNSPPKKLKMFEGTAELQKSPKKGGKKQGPKVPQEGQGQGKKRKGQFFHLKERIKGGDKTALEEVEEKLKAFAGRKELTKTARRKIKYLERMKVVLTGEKKEVKAAPSTSAKRRQRQQNAKGKNQQEGANQKKEVKSEQQKKTETINFAEDASESDSDESDEDIGAQIQGNLLIKPGEDLGEEESDDDEGEEEEESDDGDEEDDDDSAEEEEEEEPQIQKGGKKKGQEKKNEVKAKNFKLQAMRKQGQLVGSVKEGQKRSARRAKNVKANGSN